MPKQNSATYFIDRDEVNTRSAELPHVPDSQWTDETTLCASNSNGIGISTGDEWNPKIQDWGRNTPTPTQVQEGGVIGQPLKPGMSVVCEDGGDPRAGGCRTLFIQAPSEVLDGGVIAGVGVFAVYNRTGRTVNAGEWIWGDAVFGATYIWDFAEESALPPEIAFTRGTEAAYFDSDGVLQIAAVDEPRFGHSPDGTPLGFIIEGGKDNEALNSKDLTEDPWVGEPDVAVWIENYTEIAPNGYLQAQRFIQATQGPDTGNRKWRRQPTSFVTGETVTASIFIKRDPNADSDTVACLNVASLENGGSWFAANLRVSTGEVLNTSAGTANPDWAVAGAGATEVVDGWYRFWVTGIVGVAASTIEVGIGIKRDSSYGAFGMQFYGSQDSPYRAFYTWGYQAELGTISSYITSVSTFTSRASVGTFVGPTGLIETAGVDVERFTYDPTQPTRPPQQLLEIGSTNTFPHSELIGQLAAYGNSAAQLLPNELDPRGVLNGRAILEKAVTSRSGVYSAVSINQSGDPLCFSALVKAVAGTPAERLIGLSIGDVIGDSQNWFSMRFNTDNQTVHTAQGGQGEIYTAGVLPLANDWYRIYCSGRINMPGLGPDQARAGDMTDFSQYSVLTGATLFDGTAPTGGFIRWVTPGTFATICNTTTVNAGNPSMTGVEETYIYEVELELTANNYDNTTSGNSAEFRFGISPSPQTGGPFPNLTSIATLAPNATGTFIVDVGPIAGAFTGDAWTYLQLKTDTLTNDERATVEVTCSNFEIRRKYGAIASVGASIYQAPDDVFPSGNGGMSSYLGNNQSGFYLFNGQLEEAYIQTPTAPIYNGGTGTTTRAPDISSQAGGTRDPDNAVTEGVDFTNFYNPLEGTMVVRASRQEALSVNGRLWSISDGSGNNIMETLYSTAASGSRGNVRNANVQTALMSGDSNVFEPTGYAFAYKLNDFGFSGDGSATTTDTTSAVPTVNTFWYGRRPGVNAYLNGFMHSITYYSTRLPDEQLQQLSSASGVAGGVIP